MPQSSSHSRSGDSLPPRRRAGRPRTPAFGRETVAEAVVDLVCEHGYAGWSMRDLAGRLGVSTGTLTHHFASREALAIEAMDFVYVLPPDWQDIQGQPPITRLRRMTAMFVLDTTGKRRWWQFWAEHMAVAGRDPDLRARHEERYARQRTFFGRLIALTAGHELDAAGEAARLLAFGNGLAVQQLATPASLAVERARELLDLYLADLSNRLTGAASSE